MGEINGGSRPGHSSPTDRNALKKANSLLKKTPCVIIGLRKTR